MFLVFSSRPIAIAIDMFAKPSHACRTLTRHTGAMLHYAGPAEFTCMAADLK
jgi:hypothetical protein